MDLPSLPIARAPPEHPSGGPRRFWFAGLGVALAVLLGGGWVVTGLLTDALSGVGAWLAGLGSLAWRDSSGNWVDVPLADTRRRIWGAQDQFLTPAWEEVAPGLSVADLWLRRSPSPQPIDLLLLRIHPAQWQFRVVGTPDWVPTAVADLGAPFLVAVNGPYFSEEGPLGLVISDGVRRHRAVAHRAAHFLVDGPGTLPRIVNEKRALTEGATQGFQGFPAIMTAARTFSYMRVGGRGFDVYEVDRRTAVCTTRDAEVLLLVTDSLTNGLGFDELATVLGGLGCVDAMAFDGGTSTGLVVRVPGHERTVANLKPVPVVLGISPWP